MVRGDGARLHDGEHIAPGVVRVRGGVLRLKKIFASFSPHEGAREVFFHVSNIENG